MLTANAKNVMLDAIGITHLSLHTAYSAVGANEVAGGGPAYARKVVTFAAAAAGSKSMNNLPTFDVPAGTSVRWIGGWDNVAGGNFKGMWPNGGAEKEYTVDTAADTVKAPAHGFIADQKIAFYNGVVPAGLVEGTVYYVKNPTANTFQVAGLPGGVAIDLTAENSLDSLVSTIAEDVFGSQGTHQVQALSIGLNA